MQAAALPDSRATASTGALLALGIIALLTALRVALLVASPLDLFVDEAQYWLWSTAPAAGYFSKPPLIAWLIALTTGLAGDAEWGVRLASPLLHAGTAGFILLAGRALYDARTGAAAALVYLTLPAVSFSSLLISTDAPLLFFWSAAFYGLIEAERRGGLWWPALGLALGLGLLSKYAMAFFLVGWLGHALSGGRTSRRGAALALIVAGACYAPNLLWNAIHHFVSYRHTGADAELGGAGLRPGALLGFIASQIALLGPGVFLGLLMALRPPGDPRVRLLLWFTAPVLVFYLALAAIAGANANWAVSAYVAGTILAARGLLTCRWRPALRTALALNLLLGLALAGAVLRWGDDHARFPLHADPFKRLRGWEALGREAAPWRQRYPADCLLVADRATAAAMAYYATPRPAPVVKWHPPGPVRDHFDLTRDLARADCPAWLLIGSPAQTVAILPHFAHVQQLGEARQPQGSQDRTHALYRLQGFTGYPTRSDAP
ncbi:MAG TPA: glycosyltransferase family 39 protein [Candidatus Macondimonas sp.]|nr:glycosyltransferase family 39 protein [Candidatus Macondimonas sp.]